MIEENEQFMFFDTLADDRYEYTQYHCFELCYLNVSKF